MLMHSILGGIYAYIYCTKLKPKPRSYHESREQRIYHNTHGETCRMTEQSESTDNRGIKTHPFFIMTRLSKAKSVDAQTVNSAMATS